MPAQQLHLFASPKPLEERLGKSFFSALPRSPGVYIMSGPAGVLYIGQSGNLRARLATYKNARPDHAPRKVIRLVHHVNAIVWEKCESAEAARLRESELLQLHRPKFNRAGTWPQAPIFLSFYSDEVCLQLDRVKIPPPNRQCYGPFKGAISLHSSLVRLLWMVARQPACPADFPSGLLHWKVPPQQKIPWNQCPMSPARAGLLNELRSFIADHSPAFLGTIESQIPGENACASCLRALFMEDLQVLANFNRRAQIDS